jgi:hypothetical protein
VRLSDLGCGQFLAGWALKKRVPFSTSQLHHLVEISVMVNKFDLDAGEIIIITLY